MNGDLPSMAGYFDPPDPPEPKEGTVEFSLDEVIDGDRDEIEEAIRERLDAQEIVDYELVSGLRDKVTISVSYHPIDHGPDPDAAYDAMRDGD